jgi:hypothetical protein
VKAKNRTGIFDLFIEKDEWIGTRIHIWLTRWSRVNDRDRELTTVGWDAASYDELKGLVEALKHDLDVILEKSQQHF